jgi:hypothetical protein
MACEVDPEVGAEAYEQLLRIPHRSSPRLTSWKSVSAGLRQSSSLIWIVGVSA